LTSLGSLNHMSALISRYSALSIIVLSIALGFSLPQIGVIWKPYLPVLLMFLMFFVTLSIEPNEIAHAMRNYPVIVTGLFAVFVLMPLLALFAKPFVSSIVFAGIILALCCPSAIVSAFWAKAFKGDVATALVMSITTNLLSIITVPATMLIAIGTFLKVDIASMMLNLAEIILVPLIASFLVRRFVHLDWNRADYFSSKVELCILALLVWGSVAPGVEYVRDNVAEFVLLNAFMFGILALAWMLTHFLTRSFGHKKAVSIEIATTVKNAALSLVLGLTAFSSSHVLPPLIANLIAQNLLLIPAKALATEWPKTRQADSWTAQRRKGDSIELSNSC
jgi:predicted Na+-dependent transporter